MAYSIKSTLSVNYRVMYCLLEKNWPLQWIPRFFLIYLATKIFKIDADLTKLWVEELGDDRRVPEAPPGPADHVYATKVFGHNFSNIKSRKEFFTSIWSSGTWEACFWWCLMPSRHFGGKQAYDWMDFVAIQATKSRIWVIYWVQIHLKEATMHHFNPLWLYNCDFCCFG